MASYAEPLEKLLIYGTPETVKLEDWPDYLASGITTEHIPDLLRMVADPALRTTDYDEEDPKYWAPVHAWRALGQLRAEAVVEPLLQQTEELFDDTSGFSEWAIEELPDVYEAIGPAAIPMLVKCIADASWPVNTRVNAMTGLTKICTKYPEYRDEVVATLAGQLEQFAQNDPEINGYLILNLSHLKAIETLPLIQKAFADGNIDTFLINLEDVEVEFGLRERPEPRVTDFNSFLQAVSALEDGENTPPVSQVFSPPYTPIVSAQPHNKPKANKNKETKKSQAKAARKQKRKN